MDRRYFWQIPELKRFRTVLEDPDTVLGADVGSDRQQLFRKDTGKVCFDEQEAKRRCVELLTEKKLRKIVSQE